MKLLSLCFLLLYVKYTFQTHRWMKRPHSTTHLANIFKNHLDSSPVIFKSFCTAQRFQLEEVIDQESACRLVELRDNGSIVHVKENKGKKMNVEDVVGMWLLGPSGHELRMTIQHTLCGKFTEYSTKNFLVGRACLTGNQKLAILGEIVDEIYPNMSIGEFIMTPALEKVLRQSTSDKQ
jgi:hypothetical protein